MCFLEGNIWSLQDIYAVTDSLIIWIFRCWPWYCVRLLYASLAVRYFLVLNVVSHKSLERYTFLGMVFICSCKSGTKWSVNLVFHHSFLFSLVIWVLTTCQALISQQWTKRMKFPLSQSLKSRRGRQLKLIKHTVNAKWWKLLWRKIKLGSGE